MEETLFRSDFAQCQGGSGRHHVKNLAQVATRPTPPPRTA